MHVNQPFFMLLSLVRFYVLTVSLPPLRVITCWERPRNATHLQNQFKKRERVKFNHGKHPCRLAQNRITT